MTEDPESCPVGLTECIKDYCRYFHKRVCIYHDEHPLAGLRARGRGKRILGRRTRRCVVLGGRK